MARALRLALVCGACLQLSDAKTGFLAQSGSPTGGGINIESLLSEALVEDKIPGDSRDIAAKRKTHLDQGDAKKLAKKHIIEATSSLTDLLKNGGEASNSLGSLLSHMGDGGDSPGDSDDDADMSDAMSTSLGLVHDIIMDEILLENNLTKATLKTAQDAFDSNCSFNTSNHTDDLDSTNFTTKEFNNWTDGMNYSTCRANENQTWNDWQAQETIVKNINDTINEICPCGETLSCAADNSTETYIDYVQRMLDWLYNQKSTIVNRTATCGELRTNLSLATNESARIIENVTDDAGAAASPCCSERTLFEKDYCQQHVNYNSQWYLHQTCMSNQLIAYGNTVGLIKQQEETQKIMMRLCMRMECLFLSFAEEDSSAQMTKINACAQSNYSEHENVTRLSVNYTFSPPNFTEPKACGVLPSDTAAWTSRYVNYDNTTTISGTGLPTCQQESCPTACSNIGTYLANNTF